MNNVSPLNQKKDISTKNIIYELTMAFLAFIVVSILCIELTMPLTKQQESLFSIIDLSILIIFTVDYVYRLIKSQNKQAFFKSNILDLIAIIPFDKTFRIARLARLVRLTRLSKATRLSRILRLTKLTRFFLFAEKFIHTLKGILRTNGLAYVIILTSVVILIGALGITILEPGRESFGDGLWWSLVTTTTVGYGDISPESSGGRVLAGFLMIIGIGFLGMVTGSIATYFVNCLSEKKQEEKSVFSEEIEYIKEKLDRLEQLNYDDVIDLNRIILSLWKTRTKSQDNAEAASAREQD